MAITKILVLSNNIRQWIATVLISAGSADASKVPLTDSTGQLDNSVVKWDKPGAIGSVAANTVKGTTGQFTDTTPATNTSTGSLKTLGGAAIAGDTWLGGLLSTPGLQITAAGAIQTLGVGLGSVVGNARGAGAVDLQLSRTGATQVASGVNSFLAGINGAATGANSFVGGGSGCTATTTWAITVGGNANQNGGDRSFLGGGQANSISGAFAGILCGLAVTANKYGQQAQGSGTFSGANGEAQTSVLTARRATTDANPTDLGLDGGATATSRLTLSTNNSSWTYFISVNAHSTVDRTNKQAAFFRRGKILKGTTAASTALLAGEIADNILSAGAAAWTFAVSADTTNGALKLSITAEAGVQCVARIELTETFG